MGATILVADDDRAIRMVLNQALARLGHDVRMTGNAATLWRWVADGEGDLVSVVERALSAPTTTTRPQDEVDDGQLPLIGRSPAMQEIYRAIARLMGTDLTVMISGESGTGKELVARALHD